MLWVLKRTVTMRQFFEHPKHMFKLIDAEKITLTLFFFCLTRTMYPHYISLSLTKCKTSRGSIFFCLESTQPRLITAIRADINLFTKFLSTINQQYDNKLLRNNTTIAEDYFSSSYCHLGRVYVENVVPFYTFISPELIKQDY